MFIWVHSNERIFHPAADRRGTLWARWQHLEGLRRKFKGKHGKPSFLSDLRYGVDRRRLLCCIDLSGWLNRLSICRGWTWRQSWAGWQLLRIWRVRRRKVSPLRCQSELNALRHFFILHAQPNPTSEQWCSTRRFGRPLLRPKHRHSRSPPARIDCWRKLCGCVHELLEPPEVGIPESCHRLVTPRH